MPDPKRLAIITTDVKFSENVKKALERNHEFLVTAFSSARSAVDYMRQHRQDALLVDFRVKDMLAKDVIDHVRAMQPKIAVIAAPDEAPVQAFKARYQIYSLINIPIPTRRFVELLHEAIADMHNGENTDAALATNPWLSVAAESATRPIEFWVSEQDDGSTLFEAANKSDEPAAHLFNKLAAEEPPLPDLLESGTVGDLQASLQGSGTTPRFKTIKKNTKTEPIEVPLNEGDSRSIPATVILETALDQSTPIDAFSVDEFIERVKERQQNEEAQIKPLASWLEESQRYIREPDFLPNDLLNFSQALEYTSTLTESNEQTITRRDTSDWVTDPIEPVRPAPKAEKPQKPEKKAPLPPKMPPPPPEMKQAADSEKIGTEPLTVPPPPEVFQKPKPQAAQTLPYTDYLADDPRIAHLALTLTQVSLELAADATLLARDGQIVAYAGKLPKADIEELGAQLDLDFASDTRKSLIRFVTLQSNGSDYMLYTCQTEGNFTLTMLFAGTMSLHTIRRQGNRLIEALANAPSELEEIPQATEHVETLPTFDFPIAENVEVRAPFTFVWMLHEVDSILENGLAQALIQGLDVLLSNAGWQIHDLEVHADFIYLFADMPRSLSPNSIIRDLLRVSAEMAHAKKPLKDLQHFWDDSYLILQPGRTLGVEEIQRFISFARD